MNASPARVSKASVSFVILILRSPLRVDKSFSHQLRRRTDGKSISGMEKKIWRVLKRNAVTDAGVASALEDGANLMAAEGVINNRMYAHTVKENRRTPTLANRDVQSSDDACTIFKCSIRDTHVRTDWQTCLVLQTLADCGVERLSRWRADSIRAGADDEGRTLMCFGDNDKVRQWTNLPSQRVVFNACRNSRMKTVSESITPRRAIDLFSYQSHAVGPFVTVLTCPAHGATFSRSKRSTRYG